MSASDGSLELSPDAMRQLVAEAIEHILPHLASLSEQSAADTEGGAELARSLVEPLPEIGRPAPELFDFLFQEVIPKSFNTAGPGYLAYIPGGGLFHSAVADLVANAINKYVGVWEMYNFDLLTIKMDRH